MMEEKYKTEFVWLVVVRNGETNKITTFTEYTAKNADEAITNVANNFFDAKLFCMNVKVIKPKIVGSDDYEYNPNEKEENNTTFYRSNKINFPSKEMKILFVKQFDNFESLRKEQDKWSKS